MNEQPKPEPQKNIRSFLIELLSRHFSLFANRNEKPQEIISIPIPSNYKTLDLFSQNNIIKYNFNQFGLNCEVIPGASKLERLVRVKFINTNDSSLKISLFPNQADTFAKLLAETNFEIPPQSTVVHEIPLNIVDLNLGKFEFSTDLG